GHGFGTFDLGYQPGGATGFVAQAAGQFHIGGIAREGHGQVVQLHFRGELDVGFVLGGQGRGSQAATATVDALVVGQRAAGQHHTVQFIGGGGFDTHYYAAIVEQQFIADAAVLDQVRVVD